MAGSVPHYHYCRRQMSRCVIKACFLMSTEEEYITANIPLTSSHVPGIGFSRNHLSSQTKAFTRIYETICL